MCSEQGHSWRTSWRGLLFSSAHSGRTGLGCRCSEPHSVHLLLFNSSKDVKYRVYETVSVRLLNWR